MSLCVCSVNGFSCNVSGFYLIVWSKLYTLLYTVFEATFKCVYNLHNNIILVLYASCDAKCTLFLPMHPDKLVHNDTIVWSMLAASSQVWSLPEGLVSLPVCLLTLSESIQRP